MLVILFISVFEYAYFCFKSVFEYLPHSLPWPYFHIYIIWSQQVFGIVARDFSLILGNRVGKIGQQVFGAIVGDWSRSLSLIGS